jgi:hypothetical protein
MLGREEEMVLGRTHGEGRLQSRGRRRTLARSSVLLAMNMVIMLYNVNNGRKEVRRNNHYRQRWMWLQISLRRSSDWSSPFLENFSIMELGLWIVETRVI